MKHHKGTDTEILIKIIRKIVWWVNDFLVAFMSNPVNVTLIMICAVTRLVLNFVKFYVLLSVQQISIGYSIDQSHFRPLTPESSIVDL